MRVCVVRVVYNVCVRGFFVSFAHIHSFLISYPFIRCSYIFYGVAFKSQMLIERKRVCKWHETWTFLVVFVSFQRSTASTFMYNVQCTHRIVYCMCIGYKYMIVIVHQPYRAVWYIICLSLCWWILYVRIRMRGDDCCFAYMRSIRIRK